MLSDLGTKRILILFLLIVFNGLLAAYLYGYLTPGLSQGNKILKSVKQETSEKREDLAEIRVQFDVLDKQSKNFDNIKKAGFFQKQNRRRAEVLLEKIQKITNIINARASISPGVFVEDDNAGRSGRILLESPIELDLEALSDVDIFKYIYLIENHFPGHLTIEEITINREKNVDGPVLRSIANGDNPIIVTANIRIIWRTMIKKGSEEETL